VGLDVQRACFADGTLRAAREKTNARLSISAREAAWFESFFLVSFVTLVCFVVDLFLAAPTVPPWLAVSSTSGGRALARP
jgi:hypothetical protein